VTEFALPVALGTAHQITSGPDGNLWFTTLHTRHVGRITPSGVVTGFPLPESLGHPAGITAGPDGHLWFAGYTASKIGRVATDGSITEFDLPDDVFPQGIAAGPDGNLWFTEQPARVGRISPSGQVTEFPAPADSYWVTAGPDGNLWFAGWGEVSRVTTSGSVTAFSDIPTYQPGGVAASPDGAIWISGSFENNSQVLRFALETDSCVASATTLCLNNGRFQLTADWGRPDGSHGQANAVALTADAGYFWFFESGNIELVAKVLDGCSSSESYWVFVAGLTNVEVTVVVTDTQTGASRTYSNPQGTPFAPVQDTSAFPCE
jgi:sugar lactone lactonase YvrE